MPEEEREQSFIESILGAIGPEEAEAAPYGKIGKEFIKRITRGEISSTGEKLIGEKVFGKTVKNVVKGKGDWRYLQFTDGTERAFTKDVLREVVQEVGAKRYIGEFVEKEGVSKLEQAARSLQFHKSRQSLYTTKRLQEEWLRVRQAHVRQMGIETVPYVYVESEKVFMPKEYAELLEKVGRVKIRKK